MSKNSMVQRVNGGAPRMGRGERVLAFLVVNTETDEARLVVDQIVSEGTTTLQVADFLRDGVGLCDEAREAFFKSASCAPSWHATRPTDEGKSA